MHAKMITPNRSHHVTLDWNHGERVVSKEELYPVLEVTAPRVGTVTCRFSADRYRHSSGLSDWRIYLRDTDPEFGVGETTRRAINAAGEPLIREYLASSAYRANYREALASAIRREFTSNFPYGLDTARGSLATFRRDIGTTHYRNLARAYSFLAKGLAALNA